MSDKSPVYFLLFSIVIVVFSACTQYNSNNEFALKPIVIHGKIDKYKKIYNTGRITYFDAIARIPRTDVFVVDSTGNFEIKIQLPHSVYGVASLDIEGNYYRIYLQAGEDYHIVLTEKQVRFENNTGKPNQEIIDFNRYMRENLPSDFSDINHAHNLGFTIDEYIDLHKKYEQVRMDLLGRYNEDEGLSQSVYTLLSDDIKYTTAKAWINYRFDYSEEFPQNRSELPEDFYTKLYKEYPIHTGSAFCSREYIDYISNIVNVSFFKNDAEEQIAFFKRSGVFAAPEIDMLTAVMRRDNDVQKSEEFQRFYRENGEKIRKVSNDYLMQCVYDYVERFEPGIGRDLILSQGFSEIYLENDETPDKEKWARLKKSIDNESVYNYLADCIGNSVDTVEELTTKETEPIRQLTDDVLNTYLAEHKGKVIYIDFWATWCGPCRNETPYAKQLMIEFEGKDVVFLNFCTQSPQDTWENYIKQNELGGKNYLLSADEFNLLQKEFKVSGFPTYILIDKAGNVIDYNAPRPSEFEIREQLNSLL